MPKKVKKSKVVMAATPEYRGGDGKPVATPQTAGTKDYRLEYTPLSEIQGWPRNPKTHAEDVIGASIKRFGFVAPLVLDERSGRLVAGHGRLEALAAQKKAGSTPPGRILVRQDGEWLVPVVRGVAFADDREAEGYLLADNRPTELGGWDEARLKDTLRDLVAHGEEALAGVGWTTEQVADLLAAGAAPAEVGLTPEQRLEIYESAEIKQVVLYFSAAEYEDVVRRMGDLMKAGGLPSHTELFKKMLEHFEESLARDPGGLPSHTELFKKMLEHFEESLARDPSKE